MSPMFEIGPIIASKCSFLGSTKKRNHCLVILLNFFSERIFVWPQRLPTALGSKNKEKAIEDFSQI